jgi:proline dehydrogenase
MAALGITARDGVYFGQLLGMADNITSTLGQHGYRAYKYVPYGPVHETVAYLIRRMEENSGMLEGDRISEERRMIEGVLASRWAAVATALKTALHGS